jgi:hypothetical protein
VLDTTAKAVQKILTEGVDAAMNEFNRRPDPPESEAT